MLDIIEQVKAIQEQNPDHLIFLGGRDTPKKLQGHCEMLQAYNSWGGDCDGTSIGIVYRVPLSVANPKPEAPEHIWLPVLWSKGYPSVYVCMDKPNEPPCSKFAMVGLRHYEGGTEYRLWRFVATENQIHDCWYMPIDCNGKRLEWAVFVRVGDSE